MNIENIKTVVFDLDGTLYDNKGLPMKLILGDLWHMFVLSAERKARKVIMGKDFGTEEAVYEALFTEMARVKKSLTPDKARRWYDDRYMPLQVSVLQIYFQARPLVIELLEALRTRNVTVILYSDYGHAAEKLQALGIPVELFDAIVSAPELGGLKPSRQSMERLMERYELQPENMLYVGDREDTDGESSRPFGIHFHNVKGGNEAWDELLKAFL